MLSFSFFVSSLFSFPFLQMHKNNILLASIIEHLQQSNEKELLAALRQSSDRKAFLQALEQLDTPRPPMLVLPTFGSGKDSEVDMMGGDWSELLDDTTLMREKENQEAKEFIEEQCKPIFHFSFTLFVFVDSYFDDEQELRNHLIETLPDELDAIMKECETLMNMYQVKPKLSWGLLPEQLQVKWEVYECDSHMVPEQSESEFKLLADDRKLNGGELYDDDAY